MNATKGIVFDLQRASLHDGPGVRTTVFLKGCPLRCMWCHNPESQRRLPEFGYADTHCIGCRRCVDVCTRGVHRFTQGGQHVVDFDRCATKGDCVRECAAGAVQFYGREWSVAEVMAEVEKDRAYYDASDGGLTLSGGEPAMQPEFSRAMLAEARGKRIHTCVETCGFAASETLATLVPYTDMFLFDWKATDPTRHAALTGSSNDLILHNLRMLHDAGAAILLRCPLVPGVNDDIAHLRGIAALTHELPRLRGVEVLPYHDSGAFKYSRLGRPTPPIAARVPDETKIETWHSVLRDAGCRGIVPA
jgi:pyruvate formate lyase activating enzyme